jgi:hypothetical protein
MVYNHVNPMRRSLRSLATGWVKLLSAIAFQAACAIQAYLWSLAFSVVSSDVSADFLNADLS